MRISDWNSDVCSSDLLAQAGLTRRPTRRVQRQELPQAGAMMPEPAWSPYQRRKRSEEQSAWPLKTEGPPIAARSSRPDTKTVAEQTCGRTCPQEQIGRA